jgi:hypothetical protein
MIGARNEIWRSRDGMILCKSCMGCRQISFFFDPVGGSDSDGDGTLSRPVASDKRAIELAEKHPEFVGFQDEGGFDIINSLAVQRLCHPKECTFTLCTVVGCKQRVCTAHGDGVSEFNPFFEHGYDYIDDDDRASWEQRSLQCRVNNEYSSLYRWCSVERYVAARDSARDSGYHGIDGFMWDRLRTLLETTILCMVRCTREGRLPHLPIEMRDLFCRQLRVIDVYPSGGAAFGIRPCVSSVCATHFNADQLKWRECRDCSKKFRFEEDIIGDGSSVVARYCPQHYTTCQRIIKPDPGASGCDDFGFGKVGDVCKADLCPKCSVEALRRAECPDEANDNDHLCGGFNIPQ